MGIPGPCAENSGAALYPPRIPGRRLWHLTVPDREMRFVANIPILWAALLFWLDGRPRLQLGGTALVGRHLLPSNLDFFGGYKLLIIGRSPPYFSISGIPFADPPVGLYRFSRPRPKLSLSPLRSFDAGGYGHPCLQPVRLPPPSTF